MMLATNSNKKTHFVKNGITFSPTKNELFFPIQIEGVKKRLAYSFNSQISRKTGILLATITFDGHLSENELVINYASYGRSSIFYQVTGELIPLENGTLIKMLTYQRIPFWLILLSFFGTYTGLFFLFTNFGFSGIQLVLSTIVMGSIGLLLFFGLNKAFSGWNEKVAQNSVSNLLKEIIYAKD